MKFFSLLVILKITYITICHEALLLFGEYTDNSGTPKEIKLKITVPENVNAVLGIEIEDENCTSTGIEVSKPKFDSNINFQFQVETFFICTWTEKKFKKFVNINKSKLTSKIKMIDLGNIDLIELIKEF